MPVYRNHTYAVLISKRDIRALYVLTVDEINPQGQLKIRYAVKSYSIQGTQVESPGFGWEQGNR